MNLDLKIKNIEFVDQDVYVSWNDGHRSEYTTKYLRINCGCADCVEEWSQRKLLNPASVPTSIRVEDHIMIGRYAVQFLWSDAHYTGIYTFDLLRQICQCGECKSASE